ncbi:hypothetical protein L596_008815 [Steinernema carpocapsae]|uniref:Uncharacterized protein n=1 Tax=Steinernema carpocapsae TaxID=34508 RepID=A0A4U5PER0_STECR|nr:hypothetical protein L596_008815 [Steinernema carpocapsae]
MAPSIQNRFGLLQDLDSPNTEDSTSDGFTAFVVPKNRKKNRLQLAASAITSGSSYDLEWKIDSCVTGVDVSQVQPQVVDQFGVVEEMRTKKTHVVRGQKPLIPVLNYEKIRKVQEEKKMKFSSVFDPKLTTYR